MNNNLPAKEVPGGEGLSGAEATKRLAQFGYNALPEKKRNPLLELLAHFWDRFRG